MSARAPARGGPARRPGATAPPREVRIIGGQWKRTRLPVADRPGLRPTPDRVRETLFNWLGQQLDGWRVVDAFAGTGALGLEAASRGAAPVLLVESVGEQADALRAIVRKLGAQERVAVQRGNALSVLAQQPPASCDLVLLDPPFGAGLHDKAITAALPALRPGGWLYVEAPEAISEAACAAHGLALARHARAGAVHAHLLRRAGGPELERQEAAGAS